MMPAVDPALQMPLRASLALLLLWAAAHKVRDVAAFREALENYRLLPASLIPPAALLVIAAEVVLGGALLLPSAAAAAALGAAALLGVYGAAVTVNLLRGRRDIDCGCSGAAARQTLHGALVVRNAVLVAAALAAALPATSRPLTWIDGLTIAGAVAALALLYGAVDGLLAHAPALARLRARRDGGGAEPAGIGEVSHA